jgi:endonuclease/exonuclease/phosphatase family metal-dependent hydrolase
VSNPRNLRTLRVASYNIHKGLSFTPLLNRRLTIHELRDKLRVLGADIVFLQEVRGRHDRHARRYENWPAAPQYEFLADRVWSDFAYGRNSVYDAGHHGNAILSRFPILAWDNQDISLRRFERRGLLHCEIRISGWKEPLHSVCVHLGLRGHERSRQMEKLRQRIERLVPGDAPLIVAGDFNDWRLRATRELAHPLDLHEVFELVNLRPARTFPAALPLMSLDRIYVRGFQVRNAHVHHGGAWARISDHAALTATLVPL